MPEKPRLSRKSQTVKISASAPQISTAPEHLPRASSQSSPKDELAQACRRLEKLAKRDRSLARHLTRAEQEVARRQESLALVGRYGSDVLLRLGRDGKIVEVSPSSQALLGIDPESVKGRALYELVAKEEWELLRRYLQSVLRGGGEQGLLIHLEAPGSCPRPLDLQCRAVFQPQAQAAEIVGIARLRPTEPAAGLPGDLPLRLAHELKQPLTALAIAARALGQLVRNQEIEPEELVQAIDQLAAQAERAGELAKRMRLLASGGLSRREPVALADLVQGAVRLLKTELAREQVALTLELPKTLPRITVDAIQLEQVLVNLIRNAVEAMTDVAVGQRHLTISASQEGDEVVIMVSDTGRGLSPNMAERLFVPYQTTKPHGMGLGLAVSRAILQAHAGRIWAQPAAGSGTTFCLALPFSGES
jgi:signal transduction histidine kinase